MIPMEHEKCGYERQEEGMIPTAFERRGYERREEGMIPTEHKKCGYERQEEGMIPTAFEKRGYERQEETEIPSLLRKYGYMQYNNRRENHMFANYWEIQNRVKYIKEELSHIEAVEKEMPAGEPYSEFSCRYRREGIFHHTSHSPARGSGKKRHHRKEHCRPDE